MFAHKRAYQLASHEPEHPSTIPIAWEGLLLNAGLPRQPIVYQKSWQEAYGSAGTEVAAPQPQVSCRTMVPTELPADSLPPFPASPTPSRGNSELPLPPKAAAFGEG